MDLELEGRVCVVTGASRGIGLATARLLAEEGARVLIVGRDAASAQEAAAQVGGEALALDVTEAGAAEEVTGCADTLGGVWALVNNAGTSFARPLEELTDADWQGQWELHVMAPMRLMRALAPRMAAAGGGRIVNVCSSAGKRPSLTNAAYAVTKAAQLSLSRVFADRHAAEGVLVNAVAPGAVSSPLWTGDGGLADQAAAAQGTTRDEALAAQAAKIPVGRLAEPEEVAAVIALLCSPRSSAVTGAAWSADGGTVQTIV
ncbi:MAG: SDR family oxidoreductase [Actinomycetota bacterium]|nr:SDR family oxidoreductase [Solirubrobacterales bacterium]MDQ3409117.1 SDR family oxidoreductase [Actinomycetota bacterium]